MSYYFIQVAGFLHLAKQGAILPITLIEAIVASSQQLIARNSFLLRHYIVPTTYIIES